MKLPNVSQESHGAPRGAPSYFRLAPYATLGVACSRRRTVVQSRPSNRASNCTLVNSIVPFRICGHTKPLPSIRL